MDYFNNLCCFQETTYNTIGKLAFSAITITGVTLMICGSICYTTGTLISDKHTCASIFSAGLIFTFIIFITCLFGLFFYFEKKYDAIEIINPVKKKKKKTKKRPITEV